MTQTTKRTVYVVVCFEMQGDERVASVECRRSNRKAAEAARLKRGPHGYGVFTERQGEDIDADTINSAKYNEFFN